MNNNPKPTPVVVPHADGGFHYTGHKHYPRTLDEQRSQGFVAVVDESRSIHGRLVKTTTPT